MVLPRITRVLQRSSGDLLWIEGRNLLYHNIFYLRESDRGSNVNAVSVVRLLCRFSVLSRRVVKPTCRINKDRSIESVTSVYTGGQIKMYT